MTLHLDGDMWKQAEFAVRTCKRALSIFIQQHKKCQNILAFQTVDKALLLQGFAIVGAAFLI